MAEEDAGPTAVLWRAFLVPSEDVQALITQGTERTCPEDTLNYFHTHCQGERKWLLENSQIDREVAAIVCPPRRPIIWHRKRTGMRRVSPFRGRRCTREIRAVPHCHSEGSSFRAPVTPSGVLHLVSNGSLPCPFFHSSSPVLYWHMQRQGQRTLEIS